jgi:hypothetical protein
MDNILLRIIVSVLIVCILSLVGIFAFILKTKNLNKILLGMVGFSVVGIVLMFVVKIIFEN